MVLLSVSCKTYELELGDLTHESEVARPVGFHIAKDGPYRYKEATNDRRVAVIAESKAIGTAMSGPLSRNGVIKLLEAPS